MPLYLIENYTKPGSEQLNNSLVDNIIREGFINLNSLRTSFEFCPDISLTSKFYEMEIEHFRFLSEIALIDMLHLENPLINNDGLMSINSQIDQISQKLDLACEPSVNSINSQFDEIDDKWNEWSIYIGYSSNGYGTPVFIIVYSGGGVEVNLQLNANSNFPIILVPSNLKNSL